jgi:hypothetical protein
VDPEVLAVRDRIRSNSLRIRMWGVGDLDLGEGFVGRAVVRVRWVWVGDRGRVVVEVGVSKSLLMGGRVIRIWLRGGK